EKILSSQKKMPITTKPTTLPIVSETLFILGKDGDKEFFSLILLFIFKVLSLKVRVAFYQL
ncbi:hypothetical protein AOA62_28095, partial [Pseudomonas sp. 2995-3]